MEKTSEYRKTLNNKNIENAERGRQRNEEGCVHFFCLQRIKRRVRRYKSVRCIAIDDDPVSLRIAEELLRTIPDISTVRGFLAPMEALAYAREHELDIAFLDISMEEMNGIELARRLKEEDPRIAIVFITGYPEYALDAFGIHASGYIVKPLTREDLVKEVENIIFSVPTRKSGRIRAVTFGTFELYVNGSAVRFSNKKAKEFLAYLIDRRGAAVTSEQAIAVLWEDRPNDARANSLFRMMLSSLRKTLVSVGAEKILIDRRNSRSVDLHQFTCDFYDFLDGDKRAIRSYMGEYMQQYSWGEVTAAFLDGQKRQDNGLENK